MRWAFTSAQQMHASARPDVPRHRCVSGGSGKAGRHVAPYLAERGHQVTNADLVPLGYAGVADLRVDLTDAGATYWVMAGLATFEELDLPEKPTYDAVVNFAAVSRWGFPGRQSLRHPVMSSRRCWSPLGLSVRPGSFT